MSEAFQSALVKLSSMGDVPACRQFPGFFYHTAREEWEIKKIIFDNDNSTIDHHCICGHYIRNLVYIHNKKNNNTVIIGNCCMKQISIDKSKQIAKIFQNFRDLKNGKNTLKIETICLATKEQVINSWEFHFAVDNYSKRKFTPKQFICWNNIVDKIKNHYKL